MCRADAPFGAQIVDEGAFLLRLLKTRGEDRSLVEIDRYGDRLTSSARKLVAVSPQGEKSGPNECSSRTRRESAEAVSAKANVRSATPHKTARLRIIMTAHSG